MIFSTEDFETITPGWVDTEGGILKFFRGACLQRSALNGWISDRLFRERNGKGSPHGVAPSIVRILTGSGRRVEALDQD